MNSRNKGCSYERKLAEVLRSIFPDIQTCRYAGNLWLDAAKVDFINTGDYHIQAKAMERTPSYHTILSAMPKGKKRNIIIHKRNRQGAIAVMMLSDLLELLNDEKENKKAQG